MAPPADSRRRHVDISLHKLTRLDSFKPSRLGSPLSCNSRGGLRATADALDDSSSSVSSSSSLSPSCPLLPLTGRPQLGRHSVLYETTLVESEHKVICKYFHSTEQALVEASMYSDTLRSEEMAPTFLGLFSTELMGKEIYVIILEHAGERLKTFESLTQSQRCVSNSAPPFCRLVDLDSSAEFFSTPP